MQVPASLCCLTGEETHSLERDDERKGVVGGKPAFFNAVVAVLGTEQRSERRCQGGGGGREYTEPGVWPCPW